MLNHKNKCSLETQLISQWSNFAGRSKKVQENFVIKIQFIHTRRIYSLYYHDEA